MKKIDRLIRDLGDPRKDVVCAAAWALGWIGPAAAPAVPVLIALLGDPREDVVRATTLALGRLGPVAAPAVPALAVLLTYPSEDVVCAAARALGRIGPAGRGVQALVGELQSRCKIDVGRAAPARTDDSKRGHVGERRRRSRGIETARRADAALPPREQRCQKRGHDKAESERDTHAQWLSHWPRRHLGCDGHKLARA